jgi:glycosyltransferase involved in cell wall biosynthesis
MPKLSIITPCYNAAKFIGKTIESVQAQTFSDWEHIVVDDGSTDESSAVVDTYVLGDHRVRLVRQKNRGMCGARNRGFQESDGNSKYIYFLDADDCLEDSMLETMVGYLDEHPNVGIAYCNYIRVDENGRELPTEYMKRYIPTTFGVRRIPDSQPKTPFISLFCGAPVMASVSVLRRTIYLKSHGWDENFGAHMEDANLFLEFALISEIHFVQEKLYRYRQHAAQSTADTGKLSQQEKKLREGWRSRDSLSVEHQVLVDKAWRFYSGRLIPWFGLCAGFRALTRGEIKAWLRFWGGAVRRYMVTYLSSLFLIKAPHLTTLSKDQKAPLAEILR